MEFEFPEAFLLLLIIAPLVVLLRRSERRTRSIASAYKALPPGATFFITRLALVCLFIASLTVVGARPYVAYDRAGSYVFLSDVSRSMLARHTCSEPTFLWRAKKSMRDILAGVPEARFGIVAFDRFAFPITHMTDDQVYLDEVIEHGLYVGLTLEATGTELANALSVMAAKKRRLPEIYGQVGYVILLSDGHIGGDYRRRLREPIQDLRNADIKILAVGIGNPDATPLTDMVAGQCSNQHIEVDGQRVVIPLRADILTFIADATGGQYFSEAETDKLVQTLRAELRRIADKDVPPGTGQRRDLSSVFLGLATVALLGLLYLPPGVRLK